MHPGVGVREHTGRAVAPDVVLVDEVPLFEGRMPATAVIPHPVTKGDPNALLHVEHVASFVPLPHWPVAQPQKVFDCQRHQVICELHNDPRDVGLNPRFFSASLKVDECPCALSAMQCLNWENWRVHDVLELLPFGDGVDVPVQIFRATSTKM